MRVHVLHRFVFSLVLFLTSLLFVGRSDAQITGTTVQLPTFRVFSVSTTVVVPDRGTAYLGGVGRSRRGMRSYGTPIAGRVPWLGRTFADRSIGSATSASGVSVSATVIDHDRSDRELRAEAALRRTSPALRSSRTATAARRPATFDSILSQHRAQAR